MKYLSAIAALALVCNSLSAGLYVKGSVLFADMEDLKGSNSYDAVVDNSTGYTVGVGYRFSVFAVEVEGLMLKNDISSASGSATDIDAEIDQATLFANVILDVPGIPVVTPYVGVGLGFGNMDVDGNVTFSDDTEGGLSGSKTVFGYQVFGGLRMGIPATGMSVYAAYRYYKMEDIEIVGIPSNVLTTDATTAIEVGLTYSW